MNIDWTMIGAVAAILAVLFAVYKYLRSKSASTGDGSVRIGRGAKTGNIDTKVRKTGSASSTGDGAVDVGKDAGTGKIGTDVTRKS
jgi:hypothetical protein